MVAHRTITDSRMMVKEGKLIRLKRGWFCVNPKYSKMSINHGVVANVLYEVRITPRNGNLHRPKEIAARTGFRAPNYLIKKFKSATGYTPFKWKKRTSQ